VDLHRSAIVLLVFAALSTTTTARAQLLSPGKLAKPHASLEGLSNCLKCHEPGNQLANSRCLACHKAVASRASKRKGLHGQAAVRAKTCASCHAEHRGLSAKLISWGPKGESGFLHSRAGWPLQGAHAKAKCKDCHQSRRVTAADARKVQKKRKKSFLGLPTSCGACHFDEHRGQTDAKKRGCQHCHDTTSFQKAPNFKHNRDARFKLTGRHRRVRCKSCHSQTVSDVDTPASAFPAPKNRTSFVQYDNLDFNQCTDCHRDPHKGERGRRCQQCHSTRGWAALNKNAKDFGFHQKTRFPLKGAHVSVACKTCHGPHRGQRKAKYKGLPFERCADCHMDAHVGQLGEGRDCAECHTVQRFAPSSFFVDEHARARFPLEGAHRAVACRSCHTSNKRLERKVPRSVARGLKAQGRAVVVSRMVLDRPDVKGACTDCHRDEHTGQMEEKTCKDCHAQTSFKALSFDHNTDARFALEGKHAEVACAACHRPMKERPRGWKGALPVRYRPLETACATCHEDVHLGQFTADRDDPITCKRCHSASAFKPVTFDHDQSRFPLEGKHRGVECAKCHPRVDIQKGKSAMWFRGVPRECAGCHADQHGGRFQEFTP
jgi:hypothetical protein